MDHMNSQMMGLDNNDQSFYEEGADLALEDFDSSLLRINHVPKTASQTC